LSIIVENLESHFFEKLQNQNLKLTCPIPESILYYSSKVLVEYSSSEMFFDQENGKNKRKVLGEKILNASSLSSSKKIEAYKEIGDTSLVICGYFSHSLNRKILPLSYYESIGKMAYQRLDGLVPFELGVPKFYKTLATSFNSLMNILEGVSKMDQSDPKQHYILKAS